MKYRTRKELARLSMAEVLTELDSLKLEPAPHTVYPLDNGHDAQGVPIIGDPPAWLSDSQQREVREVGSTQATLEQQTNFSLSLPQWRMQLYAWGVSQYVSSLGLTKVKAQLAARKVELSAWDLRRISRREFESHLINAIHNEKEEEEPT